MSRSNTEVAVEVPAVRGWLRALPLCAALLGPALVAQGDASGGMGSAPHVHAVRTFEYTPETLHTLRTLPVQDEGRIKPFETIAQVVLLGLAEKRAVHVPDEPRFGVAAGTKLSAIEWALDLILFPDQADDYPVIVVTDSEALVMVGLGDVAKRKRDRYSYNEIAPGIQKLAPFYDEYRRIEVKERSRLQEQIVALGNDLLSYQALQASFDPARITVALGSSAVVKQVFGSQPAIHLSEMLASYDALRGEIAALEREGATLTDEERSKELTAVGDLLKQFQRVCERGGRLVWVPPASEQEEEWRDFFALWNDVQRDGATRHSAQIAAVQKLEALMDATGDGAAFAAAATDWVGAVRQMARDPEVLAKSDLEVSYHEADYFYNGLVWFLGAFLVSALMWLAPRNRWFAWAAWGTSLVGLGYVVVGITVRCVLLSRPPVSTLYETILFITGVGVGIALLVELLTRRRIAMTLGTFLGALGLFVAGQYELMEQQDTLRELQAVLRTNFWLATHVTSVTIGYAAGLVAGFIAHVYLIGKLFGWRRGDHALYRYIGRMTYGVLCFGVFFATIGTILGGIWANDSWGRFWGWDPKENGALMIVLWQLLILHGRLGGFWRDFGIALLAVLGNIVVAFSWFGVNLMEVGLHSYGFQPKTKFWLTVFYGTQLLVLLLGVVAWYLERARAKQPAAAAEPKVAGGRIEQPRTSPA